MGKREPITEIAKIHSAKAFALAQETSRNNIQKLKSYKSDPNKYKEKWQVINGVLVVGDFRKQYQYVT